MVHQDTLRQIKDNLAKTYGERLRGVILYGSEARGDASEDSDIDLLVLLTGPIRLWKELTAIIDAIYSIQLDVERSIHAIPVNVDDYEAGEYSLYRNVRREGRSL